ncbi:MAG: baseplate J/gp47 family protein [Bradyrhizobium sp.]|nr:baseplate J/gp47 family protein [Bradyrhizobium sp.]
MATAPTFTSTVPVPYVDAAGAHIPAFADILTALQNDYRGVYGADVSLDSDDQDGEWVGIQAMAFNKYCAAFAAVYNAFSPATAVGTGLSSVVKVNGIEREVPSYSTVPVTVVGVVNTLILNGVISDGTNKWALPASVLIPSTGQIVVTATCQTLGAITAQPGAISQITNPTQGWQSASNVVAATPGAPVETDPQLKARQTESTMLAATGVVDGIRGAIRALPNIAQLRIYENDTNAPDANGIPGHSICVVVSGGDAQAIAATIASRKLSAGTYGTTVQTVVTGAAGIPRVINFFRPTTPSITWVVSLKPLSGFTIDVQTQIQQALSNWTNALGIGAGTAGRIMLARAYTPALLTGAAASTFELLGLAVARDGAPTAAQDVAIAFNEMPYCDASFVVVNPITTS